MNGFLVVLAAAIVAVAFGCSGDTGQVDDASRVATTAIDSSDVEVIQAMFT